MKSKYNLGKIFLIPIILSVLTIIAVGIINPNEINKIDENWDKIVIDKTEAISNRIQSEFSIKQQLFLSHFNDIKNQLNVKKLDGSSLSVSNNFNSQIHLWKQDQLIFWNSNFYSLHPTQTKIKEGEIYFEQMGLTWFLAVYDIQETQGERYYLKYAEPIFVNYNFHNDYFPQNDFQQQLIANLKINLELNFDNQKLINKDGRKYSLAILNNFNNQIGSVFFSLPLIDDAKNEVNNFYSFIQSLGIYLIYLFLVIGLLFEMRQNKSSKLIFQIVLVTAIIISRLLIYSMDLLIYISNDLLINPQYFSSDLGWGLFGNPLELIISILHFGFVILILTDILVSNFNPRLSYFYYSYIVLAVVIIRALSATVRSFVFDSNQLYVISQNLVPTEIEAILLSSLLVTAMLAVYFITKVIIFLITNPGSNSRRKQVLIIFSTALIIEVVFLVLGWNSTAPFYLDASFLFVLIGFSFAIKDFRELNFTKMLYIAFISSLIGILYLFNYNRELEREAMMKTAMQINNPRTNLLNYWMDAFFAQQSFELPDEFTGNINFNRIIFKKWNESIFTEKNIPGMIFLFDEQNNLLADFNNGISSMLRDELFYFNKPDSSSLVKFFVTNPDYICKINNYLIGERTYHLGVILKAKEEEKLTDVPVIFRAKTNLNRIYINPESLFEVRIVGDSADYIYGNPNLSLNDIKEFTHSEFSEFGETWLTKKIDDTVYRLYLLQGRNWVNVIGLRENELSFSFFQFFKLFLFHSFIILFISSIIFIIFVLKKRVFNFNFRSKLIIAFLIVALLPGVFMINYLRQLTDSKNLDAIRYKLEKRALRIEDYLVSREWAESERYDIFKQATEDLKINFSIFNNINKEFSSVDKYAKIGIIGNLIPYEVVEAIFNEGKQRILITNSIGNYKYQSFYYRINLENDEIIIVEINNMMNKILLPMSNSEFDIFLFGSYAFAIFVIILISTLIANQISMPIQFLTRGTRAISEGDLDINIKGNYYGEIGDLVNGFNKMSSQLKRDQLALAEMEREIAWKEMAKQVAHEIKNPLTPMKLSLQHLIAAKNDKSEKFGEIFDKVSGTLISQIETLKRIATEFGNVAKMPKANIKKVDLVKISKEIVELFSDEIADIKFESNAESILILADDDQLKRVLINLVRNAIHADAQKILIKAEQKENETLLRIIDDGSGISDKNKSKIFEDNFTTKSYGMGIGLSISRRYLESINSTIDLEFSSAEGTTFLIKFSTASNE